MKIAVTYSNGEIFQHFGKTKQIELYTITNLKITSSEVVEVSKGGNSNIVNLISELGADVLICGGITEETKELLSQKGIVLYSGAQGNTKESVEGFIDGSLFTKDKYSCSDARHGCGSCHGCQ
jgi:predicted Fe-Mo cluster-binding NifX family protein